MSLMPVALLFGSRALFPWLFGLRTGAALGLREDQGRLAASLPRSSRGAATLLLARPHRHLEQEAQLLLLLRPLAHQSPPLQACS